MGKSIRKFKTELVKNASEYSNTEQFNNLVTSLNHVLKDVANPPPIPGEILDHPSVMKTIQK
jgi:hypothetical protein